jgi:hypothetical protein
MISLLLLLIVTLFLFFKKKGHTIVRALLVVALFVQDIDR